MDRGVVRHIGKIVAIKGPLGADLQDGGSNGGFVDIVANTLPIKLNDLFGSKKEYI